MAKWIQSKELFDDLTYSANAANLLQLPNTLVVPKRIRIERMKAKLNEWGIMTRPLLM